VWTFSEKFMEDCIHANPTAFLDEKVEIVARQQRIGGFIPDLIVRNHKHEILIVEIQQRALDHYHLYKSLEYRDLIRQQDATSTIRIVLFCETMDVRFRLLLKTHSIELIEMDRKRFVAIAVVKTPEIVQEHLSREIESLVEKQEPEEIVLEFHPLNWGGQTSPSSVLAHLYKEFGRLNIDIHDIRRDYYRQICWDICNLFDENLERALEKIWLPRAWNYDRVLVKGNDGYSSTAQTQLRKPRISISPYITQKGNLSVTWSPTNYYLGESESDWKWWPGDGSVGWSRPENELFFIREVSHLNPGIHLSEWDDRVNYHVLDGIFIGLLKASLQHFFDVCRVFFEIEIVNDIEVDLSGPEAKSGNMFPERYIVGWRIYNLEERKRRNENEWFASFEKNYGFSIDLFSKSYRVASFCLNRERPPDVIKKVTNELKKRGHKITEGQVRSIVERMNKHPEERVRTILK